MNVIFFSNVYNTEREQERSETFELNYLTMLIEKFEEKKTNHFRELNREFENK